MASTLETKAAALEGLDFIETEEDVKAVEAATLKIQSTFRGKKIRSKVGAPKAEPAKEAPPPQQQQQQQAGSRSDNDELSAKVAELRVQDNNKNNNNNQMDGQAAKAAPANAAAGPPEEEAERAATKIQAGFKGYKTRKELEGKLPGAAAGQPEPAAE